jgi:L-aminopeptidase/D-esterase-like protein
MGDGDIVVAMSVGSEQAGVDGIGVAAAEAVSEAILRAVRLAPSMGGLPGLRKA